MVPPGHRLAREAGESDAWLLAARYAERMLPGIFRTAERDFQGRRGAEVFGEWTHVPAETGPPPRLAAFHRVPLDQPLGRLAFMLLEPRSDDGVVAWGMVSRERAGTSFPILRVP